MINVDNCFDLELEEIQDKINEVKPLIEERGWAFLTVLHFGGWQDEKYTDIEGFLLKAGVDLNKVEGNINGVLQKTLDKLTIELNFFLATNFNTYGYKAKLKAEKLFADIDIIVFLYK
jgi:hypothetical protein